MKNTIYLIGEVGYEVTLQNVIEQYNKLGKVDSLLMVIHSNGGSVTEGMAIFDWIKGLTKAGVKVTTRATGMCASIASVILCAAPLRQATVNATIHPHNPWVGDFQGDAKAFSGMSAVLEDVEMRLERIYSQATGKDIEAVSELLSLDQSMSVSQALEFGIINEVLVEDDTTAKAKELFNSTDKKTTIKAKFDIMANKNKGLLAQISNMFSGEQETKAALYELADGTGISTDAEGAVAVGQMVSFTESEDAVPDGSHELNNGTVIVTEGGVITEVVEAEVSAEVTREELTALQEEVREVNESNAATLSEIQDSIKMIAEQVIKAKGITTKKADIPEKDSNSKFKKVDPKASKRAGLEDYVKTRKAK